MTNGRDNGSARTFTQAARNVNRAPSIRQCLKQVRTGMYVVLCLFTLASIASAQASRNKKPSTKPANPTNGSPTTLTLDVDQMYCDESLPYSYQSDPSKVTLQVGVAQNTDVDHDPAQWAKVMGDLWKSASALPSTVQVSFEAKTTYSSDGNGKDAATNDAPTDRGLLDSGLAILGNPKQELSNDTFDAQRLLVRTLFGPNPFQVACADAYLRYPTGNVPSNSALPQLTKGAGYPFSLNDKNAPKYYLINIVRWKDATPPKGTSANDKPPQTMPFFQAASDDWYLLNYSDSQDRPQDISQWFHKITPAMMSETLRIIGSDKVMFLGIHLAPLPVLGDKGIPNPNSKSAPATEQAWFDAVSLKYTFQASAATPTNMADLNTLLSILMGGLTGAAGKAQQAASNAPGPKAFTPQTVADALKQLKAAVQAANEALDQEEEQEQKLNNKLDLFLHQLSMATLPPLDLDSHVKTQPDVIAEDTSASDGLLVVNQLNQGPLGARISVNSNVEAKLTELSKSDSSKDEVKAQAKSTAIAAIQQDIDSMSRLQAEINARKAALGTHGIMLSTYQGRYAAGLLTNLKNLPVTLASNWTASFSVVTVSPKWAGNADVYDLTKPTTDADKSNRAGIASSKAEAKKTDGKSGDTPTTPTLASGSGGTSSADAAAVWGAAPSTHLSFGPSFAASDPRGLFDFVDDPVQDSPQSSKDTTAQDPSKQPSDGKNKNKNPGKNSGATSNSSKDATATASAICTISLTPGSTTANPQTQQTQTACSDQQTKILDEGRSRWDVSVIVPITGYKDLTFQAASSGSSGPNIITAKTITRENAYGVFDLYLIPEDLINPPYLGIPHVVVGLPFAGQVFNKPYFAVGETINIPKMIAKIPIVSKLPVLSNFAQKDLPLFVRPVFGWVDNKVYPTGGAPTYRSLKPQFSIEMSFSSIKNAVQTLSKNSSNGTGNTTKPTTPSSVPNSN
jgi:hypothetical protein